MDDFLKRLVVAYLGFTAALWAISHGTALNGSAYPGNSAWEFVTGLRFYFTLPIVLVLAFAGVAGLFWAAMEAREQRQKALEAHLRAERELREAEVRRRKAVREKRLEAEREAARLVRQQEAEAEAKRQREEREKQRTIEKQVRSASDAAERALDDF